MKCPKCSHEMTKLHQTEEDKQQKVTSHHCMRCEHIEFERVYPELEIMEDVEKHTLEIKQNIVKLSHNRLGMYFNKNIIQSLGLKAGEEVLVSVPEKKRIVIKLK